MRAGSFFPRMGLGACALLLFQTLFWAPDGLLITKLALGAFAVFAWLRPRQAMLITAAFAPLSGILSDLAGLGSVRGGEAIVLAFLAGWLLQPRDVREVPSRPARVTAALFIVTIAASCAVSVWIERLYWTGPPGFVQGLLLYLGTGYLHQPGFFRVISLGMLLVEGVGLLAAVPAICDADPRWTRRLLRMTVAGGVGAACTSLLRLGLAIVRSEQPLELLSRLYGEHIRLSVHVGDVNAAGSYFAFVGLLALGGAASSRRSVVLWIGSAIAVGAALLLSGSRSALTAGMVVLLAGSWLLYGRPRSPRRRRIGLIGMAIAVTLTVLVTSLFPHVLFGRRARRALEIRAAFVETSLKMFATKPAFGIGIGEYFAHSSEFMPPWLKKIYPRENAHNYFLQIAAELGAVGGVLFLSVIALALRESVQTLIASRGDPQLGGLVAGLTAFLATCLAGHPFLQPPVAFAFWMGLGLAVARSRDLRPSPAPATTKGRTRLALACASVILLSIPVRARHEIDELNLSRVSQGFYAWQETDNGVRYRWTSAQAMFYVPSTTRSILLPIGGPPRGTAGGVTQVALLLDGRTVNQITLEENDWVTVRMLIPQRRPGVRFRRIDLVVSPTWTPDRTAPPRRRRVAGIRLGEVTVTGGS